MPRHLPPSRFVFDIELRAIAGASSLAGLSAWPMDGLAGTIGTTRLLSVTLSQEAPKSALIANTGER